MFFHLDPSETLKLMLTIKSLSGFIASNSCARRALASHLRTRCKPFQGHRVNNQVTCLHLLRTVAYSYVDFSPFKRLIHATAPRRASPKNPYEVLGLKPEASAADIKKTYFAVQVFELYVPYPDSHGHDISLRESTILTPIPTRMPVISSLKFKRLMMYGKLLIC